MESKVKFKWMKKYMLKTCKKFAEAIFFIKLYYAACRGIHDKNITCKVNMYFAIV